MAQRVPVRVCPHPQTTCVPSRSGYLNRFDEGLVIYWFGYDASIDTDPRLLILSGFPDTDCEIMTACNHG